MEVLAFISICALLIFFTFHQVRLIYNRYFRAYKKEIYFFLKSRGYEYVETVIPNDNDWIKSQFQKPTKAKFGILLIKINGIFVTWSTKDYLIIIGQKKGKAREFWTEIKTTYFQKPIITFREGSSIKNHNR